MSAFTTELRQVTGGVASRLRRLHTALRRATPVPLAVRTTVFLAGALAMLLGLPGRVLLSGVGLALVSLALLPAIAPRTRVVTVIMFVPVVGWLATTSAYGVPITLVRLVALASALYLTHSAAALAAALPYDAIVSGGVLLRWAARAGLVLLATAVVAVYALVAGEIVRGPAFLAATVVGLAVAVGLAMLLARQLRRR